MFNFLKRLFSRPDLGPIYQAGAIILDVRTPAEFKTGHVKGSVNIPLNVIANKVEKIKKYNKPVVTCCRSGSRSGMAANLLKQHGIEVYNGGSWNSVRSELKAALASKKETLI